MLFTSISLVIIESMTMVQRFRSLVKPGLCFLIIHWQIDIRRRQDIHSRSTIRVLKAESNLYAAIIGEKLCMKLGDGSWCPSGRDWTLATSGHRYAVWHK